MHMTFQASKNLYKNQEGVTLLLSILLLAAITSISFSLAAVGFAEVATSDDLAHTEPILYSSLGVAEEATYGMKRVETTIKTNLGTNCAPDFVSYASTPLTTIASQTKLCNINASNDIEVSVPPNNYNTAVRLYIYDPTPPNSGTENSGYTNIQFKKNTNNFGIVKVYMCRLDTDCADPTPPSNQISGWSPAGDSLLYNVLNSYSLQNQSTAPKCCSYEVVLVNSGVAKDIVEVITQPKGLPYLNKTAIEIQSSFGRLIRRLKVLVPTQ